MLYCLNGTVSRTKKLSFLHRNVGLGTSSAAGRLGAITSPFVIWLVGVIKQASHVYPAYFAGKMGTSAEENLLRSFLIILAFRKPYCS